MSSRLAFAPERVKAFLATSKMRSRLRCASARGFRLGACERFVGISKNSKKLATGGHLRLSYVMRRHSPFYARLGRLSIGSLSKRTGERRKEWRMQQELRCPRDLEPHQPRKMFCRESICAGSESW